jgi:acetate kinase
MTDVILALNAGSSSLKFSLFVTRGGRDTVAKRVNFCIHPRKDE